MRYSLLKNTGDAAYITVKAMKKIQLADIIWHDRHVDREALWHAKDTCNTCSRMEEVLQLCRDTDKTDLRVVRMTEERDSSGSRERFELAVFKASGFDVEIVPGISNINRITAVGSFPLTVRGRNESFWVWDGASFSTGKVFDIDLWERVAATRATMAIMNPPAIHLFRGLEAVAARRHAQTPVLFCNKDGQYEVVSLGQLTASRSIDCSGCHLLVINPSPKSLPRVETAYSTAVITAAEGCVAS